MKFSKVGIGFWVLVATLTVGLRIAKLAELPAGLNRDEAALGYNAFLLTESGQDEWGQSWPLLFRSFGDYKLGGYIYTVAALLPWFGQTALAIRLPAALAGMMLVPLGYWLTQNVGWTKRASQITAVTLAVSPLFLFYSRMGWEAMLALSWWMAVLVLITWPKVKQRFWMDTLAVVCLALAMVTYNTPLFLSPLLIGGLIWVRGVKKWRWWWWPVLGIAIVWASLGYLLTASTAQKSMVTIFGNPDVWFQYVEYRQQLPAVFQTVIGNRYIFWLGLAVKNWWLSYNPAFLVWHGGSHPWHQVPQTGHIVLVTYIFGIGGWIVGWFKNLWRQKFANTWEHWLAVVTPVSLVPAIITVDAPHATRSLFFIVCIVLWSAWGIDGFLTWVKSKQGLTVMKVVAAVLMVGFVAQSSWYLWRYFTWYPHQSHLILRSGLNKVLTRIETEYPQANIAIVDEDGYAYAMVAWYLQLPPTVFVSTLIRQAPSPIGLYYGQQIGRYHFISKPEDRSQTERILVQWKEQDWFLYDFGGTSNTQ